MDAMGLRSNAPSRLSQTTTHVPPEVWTHGSPLRMSEPRGEKQEDFLDFSGFESSLGNGLHVNSTVVEVHAPPALNAPPRSALPPGAPALPPGAPALPPGAPALVVPGAPGARPE